MNKSLSPLDIRKAFLDVRKSARAVATRVGVSHQLVWQVIHRKAVTPYIRRSVAEDLGMTYLQVWGEEDPGIDRYGPHGRRGVTPSVDTATDVAGAA